MANLHVTLFVSEAGRKVLFARGYLRDISNKKAKKNHPHRVTSLDAMGYGLTKLLVLAGENWPAACICTRRAQAPNTLSRRSHEEAEGFLSYRVADRRGDHSDHCGHRYPEPHAFAH